MYWQAHSSLIIAVFSLLTVIIGGFVLTYEKMQSQDQLITTLSVKVDALSTQLQTIQSQNAMLRRNILGTTKKNKRNAPLVTPTGFGL